MKLWELRKFNILALLFMVAGCSDTNPTVSILRSIEGFDFNPTNVVTASMNNVPLQATCSSFVGAVEMSFDGGTTWVTPTSYDPAVASQCANGSFQISLSDSKAPWSSMTFTNGQMVTVKFRAQPRIGNWIYRNVTIKYSPSTTISQEILAGAKTQTGTNMVLKGRVRAQEQHVASGGGFVIKGRIAQ
ncbi:hypothetical protein [Bdellovibrio bacteriovorus]|uniref:hypothetical protein n=1 Tax=Bdellovibrio bacteriovorus TaxID=959 RepID=UPI0035A7337F